MSSSLARAVYRDICRNIERQASPTDVLISLLWARGVQAALLYRLAHWCFLHHLRAVSEVLLRISQLLYGVDIAYQADIGPGLVLRHAMTVVIGRECRLGRDVTIYQGVTIGNRMSGSASRPDGSPVIGDGVTLGAGAKILGPIEVGAASAIGANSVVTRSVPPSSIAAGAPARLVRTSPPDGSGQRRG